MSITKAIQIVAVWEITSFWQLDITFCSLLDNRASVKDDKSNFVLRACYLLSLSRPMLPSVGGLIAIFTGASWSRG